MSGNASVGDIIKQERKRCVEIILGFNRFASCTPEQIAEAIMEDDNVYGEERNREVGKEEEADIVHRVPTAKDE